ncbi:type II secretion system F family protein [Paraburkholderia tropica]|uniref:type II secretion system F family protein n=1 Tax=Paraburkholderia tropica TaxID=92647 RepID=UPI0007EDE3E5|nr:type II secretion system F family protein [Paraburkholderia tropica]MBB2983777.1 tight adherence protein B [Paraburkholderia tropica]OBR48629.1 type II secretion protein F [Paraburkholderia tropica]
MASIIALAAALALLFAAAGLMLWQRAQQHTARERVTRFVDSRVAAAGYAAGAAGPGGSGAAGVGGAAGAAGAARAGVAPIRVTSGVNSNGSAAGAGGAGATGATGASHAANAKHTANAKNEASLPRRWLARVGVAFEHVMSRAGIADARKPALFVGFAALALALWAYVAAGLPALLGALMVVAAGSAFVLSVRIERRRRKLVGQLPSFLDGIVRLIVLGNSVPAAFQAALVTTEAPLRECLDHVSRMLRSGVEIDRALYQVAQVYRARELEFVGSVLRLSVRYGGRADVMLERMSNFMRDLEQAQRELIAMSAETRLSAWVLGLLPIGIAGFLIVTNPSYFGSLWDDGSGRKLVYAAIGLQVFGGWLLYRLTRLKGGL